MFVFQTAQKDAFQRQGTFSLYDAAAQNFLNMKGKLPINVTEQMLKGINP